MGPWSMRACGAIQAAGLGETTVDLLPVETQETNTRSGVFSHNPRLVLWADENEMVVLPRPCIILGMA